MSRRRRFEHSSSFGKVRRSRTDAKKFRAPLSRRLRLEPLEDRRMLSITVNTLVDENNGIGVGGISLREAVAAAMPGETIDFSVLGTIELSSLGQISINKSLSINGPGPGLLTIRAYDPTPGAKNGDGSRVFNVDDGVDGQFAASIRGLTLTGGDMAGNGGAIRNAENLTLTDLLVRGNSAGTTSVGYHGGGVANAGGNLTIQTSTISGNSLTFGSGGGIYSSFGSLSILDSTISDNAAGFTNHGGGIYTNYTPTTINRSTISGNSATIGGGITLTGIGVVMSVTSSTISGNEAVTDGGGIAVRFSTLSMKHSTIADNLSDADNNGSGTGGGLFVTAQLSPVTIDHVIVARNMRGFTARNDVAGPVAARFCLLGVDTGATIINQGGNLIGTSGAPIDPLLTELTDNGGLTKTHELLAGSPAIDAGDAAIAAPPANDQRGAPFARVTDGDGAGGARIDIGAYERQTLTGLNLVVDTLVDEYDSNVSAGDLSLREALSLANGSVGPNSISFAGALTSGGPATLLLTKGELGISDDLSIVGPGANLLTIRAHDPDEMVAGDGSRIFDIDDGVPTLYIDDGASTLSAVTISGLTLTGADTVTRRGGGGIYSRENLHIDQSIIRDNKARLNPNFSNGSGGGIWAASGVLLITDSTISGNQSESDGGGIYSLEADLTVVDSVISGNRAAHGHDSAYGGGIYNGQGQLTVLRCAITGNYSYSHGGGISSRGADVVTVTGSTITDNISKNFGGGIAVSGSATQPVTISASNVSGNFADYGGGIYSGNQDLTIDDSTIADNYSDFGGGGVASFETHLTVRRSAITGNDSLEGGGIQIFYGTIAIVETSISGNDAPTGGGISQRRGVLLVDSSTLSGNTSFKGGALYSFAQSVDGTSKTTVVNSTISGNAAVTVGGGILNAFGPMTIWHSTITDNQAPVSMGGGVASRVAYTQTKVGASIISGNASGGDVQFVDGASNPFQSLGFNLVGIGNGVGAFSALGGDLIGVAPQIGPLADNGGPTQTHALLAGSPAIDRINPTVIMLTENIPEFDQRGAPFARIYDGDGVGGLRIDVGAFELQPIPAAVFGDFNLSGIVDAADYTVWRNTLGTSVPAPYTGADGSGNGTIGPEDYDVWKLHFGETLPGVGSGSGELVAGNQPQGVGEESTAGQASSGTQAVAAAFFDDATLIGASTFANNGSAEASPFRARAVRAEGDSQRDNALLAWLSTSADTGYDRTDANTSPFADSTGGEIGTESEDAFLDGLDAVFQLVGGGV